MNVTGPEAQTCCVSSYLCVALAGRRNYSVWWPQDLSKQAKLAMW